MNERIISGVCDIRVIIIQKKIWILSEIFMGLRLQRQCIN